MACKLFYKFRQRIQVKGIGLKLVLVRAYFRNFELENKGIVFKARWFVRLDITRA